MSAGAVRVPIGGPSRWRTRTLMVALVVVVAGHALACAGLLRGMPAAPWGDEARYYADLAAETMRIVWTPWREPSIDAHAPAELARGIVPLILLWLAGEALVRQLRNPWRLMRIARRGDHAVLLGLSPIARHVLAHWVQAGRSAMVVSTRGDDESAAIAGGAAYVESDWHVEDMPRRAAIGRAASVACVTGTDVENIDAAVAVTRAAESLRPAGVAPLVVFAKVEDPFLRARIDERIDRFASLDRVQLRLFSAAQISVRGLLRDHPIDCFVHAGAAAPHLWVFGFGVLGEALAVEAIRQSPVRSPGRLAITVVEPQAMSQGGPFLLRWPGATAVSCIRFTDGRAEEGAPLLDRLLGDASDPPSALYFCHPQEEVNLAAALQVCGALQARGLHVPPVYLSGSGSLLRGTGEGIAGHPWIHPFGDAASIAGEFLLGEKLDGAARAIHEAYLAEATQRGEEIGARRSLRPWLLLAEDLKDDNRALADHHFVKVRAAGCTLARHVGTTVGDPGWSLAEVESLAAFEHERWMNQRLLAGWEHDARRDDQAKRHPDLVSYAALPDARQELDRAVVRDIPVRLAGIGYAVRRELSIEISGPVAPWVFAPAFEEAVAGMFTELKARAAGQSLLLLCGLRSAMACRVAELALAANVARLGLVLDEPAQVVLGRQATPEIRLRLFALLQRAEKIVAGAQAGVLPAGLRLRLSIDGSDLEAAPDAWGIDSAGRVLFRPQGIAA